mmetsp:Transcript_20095/g.27695  ORF Transcript_20095/g.27695 Transcript_20095/m.27695 type:complete len:235 (+) Transcript_20095:160-864(+)|eukprot:CAMPEP_0170074422 /NCGR_PEP_ID=MMETSP0019_2-20121128/11716_1 /TAXON_ID=98059 /ORGANISM="Dinobryon sp., Strain UTEXLB2267" /LENGTH=234 /DNA_ID=CAMNT_0010284689 /DNA_START=195 /DNA_END=899 /DNA_ORIENTATION=-
MSDDNDSTNNTLQPDLRIITEDLASLPRPKKTRVYATISEATTPSSNRSNINKHILSSSSSSSISGIAGPSCIVNNLGDGSNVLEVVADASEDGESSTDKSRGRGGYLCRKCNQPKKGHICPAQELQVPQPQKRPTSEQLLRTFRPPAPTSSSSSSALPPPPMPPPPELPQAPACRDVAVQAELDESRTLRELGDLGMQGVPSSYEAMSLANLNAWRQPPSSSSSSSSASAHIS